MKLTASLLPLDLIKGKSPGSPRTTNPKMMSNCLKTAGKQQGANLVHGNDRNIVSYMY